MTVAAATRVILFMRGLYHATSTQPRISAASLFFLTFCQLTCHLLERRVGANIVVNVRLYLLVDRLVGRGPVPHPGRHRLGGGQLVSCANPRSSMAMVVATLDSIICHRSSRSAAQPSAAARTPAATAFPLSQ